MQASRSKPDERCGAEPHQRQHQMQPARHHGQQQRTEDQGPEIPRVRLERQGKIDANPAAKCDGQPDKQAVMRDAIKTRAKPGPAPELRRTCFHDQTGLNSFSHIA